jgi:protein SCO1/2
MGLSYLGQALKRLTDAERAQVKTLFISVDPSRDTLEHLATYAPFFHPDIRGVGADEATLRAAAAPFGVSWAKVGADGGPAPAEGYLIDHTAFVSVVDAEGRLVGRIAHAANPAAAVAVIRRFLPGGPK